MKSLIIDPNSFGTLTLTDQELNQHQIPVNRHDTARTIITKYKAKTHDPISINLL